MKLRKLTPKEKKQYIAKEYFNVLPNQNISKVKKFIEKKINYKGLILVETPLIDDEGYQLLQYNENELPEKIQFKILDFLRNNHHLVNGSGYFGYVNDLKIRIS